MEQTCKASQYACCSRLWAATIKTIVIPLPKPVLPGGDLRALYSVFTTIQSLCTAVLPLLQHHPDSDRAPGSQSATAPPTPHPWTPSLSWRREAIIPGGHSRRWMESAVRRPACYILVTPSSPWLPSSFHSSKQGFVISWQWSLLDKLGKIFCFVQKELIQNICQIWEAEALCQIWEAAACVLSCKGKHFVCPCGGEPLQNCVNVKELEKGRESHAEETQSKKRICNFIAMVFVSLLGKLGDTECNKCS